MRRTPLAALLAVVALVGWAPPAGARGLYEYTFTFSDTEHSTTSGQGDDTGVCEPIETVDLVAHVATHVSATEPGLTVDDVEALLDDDPDGVLIRVTYTETGAFVANEGGHTYTGHFTQWFGGGLAGGHFGFTFTFTVVGTSELGTPLHAHFLSHFVGTEDLTKVEFDRGSVEGCLPAA
jgi:hypothetical protein